MEAGEEYVASDLTFCSCLLLPFSKSEWNTCLLQDAVQLIVDQPSQHLSNIRPSVIIDGCCSSKIMKSLLSCLKQALTMARWQSIIIFLPSQIFSLPSLICLPLLHTYSLSSFHDLPFSLSHRLLIFLYLACLYFPGILTPSDPTLPGIFVNMVAANHFLYTSL